MPWNRQLGGARIYVELAEEMEARGHKIDRFTLVDAFGPAPAGRRLRNRLLLFPRHLAEYIRSHPGSWDVIDAFEGDLPYTKERLRHRGLLVCRSLGARASYQEFLQESYRRWPAERTGKAYLRPWRDWESRRSVELGDRSARAADVVFVPNGDEEVLFASRLGLGARTVRVPFGLTDARLRAFEVAARSPSARHTRPQLAFVGTWTARKGARDMRQILERLRLSQPRLRLALLGVTVPEERVRMDMGNPDGLSVVEHFASEDLPGLLASTTVGVFPSYVEGFGFAVLEKLAAGIPVVAYDAPGPREMLNGAPWRALTPPGDLNAFSDAVNSVLNAPGNRYAEMSSQARQIAHGFRWPSIAEQTLTLYKNRLDSLRP